MLATLGTETIRPGSAAQCVAYIACAELPTGMWPELISVLTSGVTSANSTDLMKETALEAIGYICQDIVRGIIEFKSVFDTLSLHTFVLKKKKKCRFILYHL